jgi:hypothetical protein
MTTKSELGTKKTPWARTTDGKAWSCAVYNWPVTFGQKPLPKLIKRVRARHWAGYEGPWSRAGLVDAVYNGPAFASRILSDNDLCSRSARAGRNPLTWQFRERAFMRAWDRLNNGPTDDIGGLFMSMLCNEMLEIDLNAAGHLYIAERAASEMVAWLGSPTGFALLKAGHRHTGAPLLFTWDMYNNGAANSANPLLMRLLSDETKEAAEENLSAAAGWRTAEIMAASLIGWLDTPAGYKFVDTIIAEADAEAKAMTAEIRKHRLLLQSVGEIPSPSEYERGLIKEEKD